jgi:hypothetical protein
MLAVAGLVLADDRAAVATPVDQRRDAAVGEPRDYDRMLAEHRRLIVAVLGDLLCMGEVDPSRVEDALHLQIEDFRVRINGAMDRVVADHVLRCQGQAGILGYA